MDVNAVLLGVQERDKWRHRLALLESALAEVRSQREKLSGRLRRIKRDLARLKDYSEAILDPALHPAPGGRVPAANNGRLTAR